MIYDLYWTSRKSSSELIKLSSIYQVSLVFPPVIALNQQEMILTGTVSAQGMIDYYLLLRLP